MTFHRYITQIGLLLALSACGAPPQASPAAVAPPLDPEPAQTAATAAPSHTPVPSPTPPPPHPTPPAVSAICPPLEGLTLEDLYDILSNPYNPPRPGFDQPHHGVDFAYYRYRGRIGMLGLPVYAVVPGVVAGVVHDRFPYGNTLIIETPLEDFPETWLSEIGVPTPAPTLVPVSPLTCPDPLENPGWDVSRRSLYTLYAHLQNPPAFQPGDAVQCGQKIGEVGNTGNSYNPHLHFETRAGPAEARFNSMAHHVNNATEEEMRNYCTWRISGAFQMFNPMQMLDFRP